MGACPESSKIDETWEEAEIHILKLPWPDPLQPEHHLPFQEGGRAWDTQAGGGKGHVSANLSVLLSVGKLSRSREHETNEELDNDKQTPAVTPGKKQPDGCDNLWKNIWVAEDISYLVRNCSG